VIAGVLLTILFSALHAGQVKRMTYPDLVPVISGFTEWFFIDVFVLVVLSGRRSGVAWNIRSSIQEILEKSRR
jgi:hypothetical protein